MRNIRYLLTCCLALFFIGCTETDEPTAVQTGIRVSLQEEVKVESRKTPEEIGAPQAANFSLKVTRQSDGNVIYDDLYTSEVIPAAAGSYSLEASYGANESLAIDAPYYKGSVVATVEDGETASATIPCKVANALASVKFSDEGAYTFANQFSSYGVRVAVDNHSTVLSFNTDGSAYYRAGSKPTFTFEGRLKSDNTLVSVAIDDEKFADATTFAAGMHCVITLKLVESAPGVTIEVSKVEVEEVTITETIPLEWLPKPKVTATGFDTNNNLSFVETEALSPKLELNLASALQDIKFTFNFQDAQFSLDSSKEYALSNAEDKAIVEEALGVTLPEVGATEASLDLSALVGKLQTNDGTATINSLVVDVKANDRWSSEDAEANNTYTLTCNKPEFSVAVQDANCWSREFTVDEVTVSGNADAEKIKANLVYQYYNGSEWVNCTTRENVAGRVQQFAEAAEELSQKTYQVRALYRGAVASEEVQATLENPTAVPNGNMDAWTSTTRRTQWSILFGTRYADQPFFQPWNESVSHWWDTNSIATMPASITATSTNYKCFPTATYKEPGYGNSGKAAVIRTISVNNGNISSTSLGSNIRGVLYAGITGEDGTMTEGRTWESRPTSLTFRCMYDSYDNERFGSYVELYNGETLIASGFYKSVNNEDINEFALVEIPLVYLDETKKATKICIKFCSVAVRAIVNDTDTGDDNPAIQKDVSVEVPEGSGSYYGVHGGSKMTIDDITLVYNK